MALARTGQANAAADNVAIPTHAVGDVIVGVVRRANNTAPTTPTAGGTVPAWTIAQTGGSDGLSLKSFWFVATAADHTTGSWTLAQRICVAVYRPTGGTTSLGASSTGNAVSAAVTYPALTLQNADSTSVVVRTGSLLGTPDVDMRDNPPTNYTHVCSDPNPGTTVMALLERLAVAANPTADANGGTISSQAWRCHSLEIKFTAVAAASLLPVPLISTAAVQRAANW